MPQIPVISSGMAGVDMTTNPLFLPNERLAGATNMVFEEGVIKTRPGFRYHDLGIAGKFQGTAPYSPSRGLSHMPFADPFTALIVAAGKKVFYTLSKDGYFADPVEIQSDDLLGDNDVNIFQAENYLIVQSHFGNTRWWEGYGKFVISPGLDAEPDTVKELLLQADLNVKELVGANIDCCFQKIELCEVTPILEPEEDFGSHDSLITANHRNFLINSAGVGVYANGRIHQQGYGGIFVSDLIHKRGTKKTDDILLMEEQQAGSFGDPLSAPSRLGQLRALEVYPAMQSATGEEQVVAYYDHGTVTFNTSAVPRETRFTPEGEMTQKGWSEIRQINHVLNRIGATGRYAVGILPRDHAFRSRYGIHLLRTTIGDGVFNDEFINTLSQDVQPILDADDKSSLKGVTVGQWTENHRLLTSVGMIENLIYSSSSMGRGFVVWNQATTFTEDRTPRPLWEGLWSPHCEIAGIHRLVDATPVGGSSLFGFVGSKASGAELVFGEMDKSLQCDILDDNPVPIEWNITSRKIYNGFSKYNRITQGRLELEASGPGGRVRVMVRTDTSPEWQEWEEDTTSTGPDSELFSLNLGLPPEPCRVASWFQFKVEGIGHATVRHLEVEMSQERGKMGKSITTHNITEKGPSFHTLNTKPSTSRWS